MKKRVIRVICALIVSSTHLSSSNLDETNRLNIVRIPIKFVGVSHNEWMEELRGRGTQMTIGILDHIPLNEALKQGLNNERKYIYQKILDSQKYALTSLSVKSLEEGGYVLEPVEFLYHSQKKDRSYDLKYFMFNPYLRSSCGTTAKALGIEQLVQNGYTFKLEFRLIYHR